MCWNMINFLGFPGSQTKNLFKLIREFNYQLPNIQFLKINSLLIYLPWVQVSPSPKTSPPLSPQGAGAMKLTSVTVGERYVWAGPCAGAGPGASRLCRSPSHWPGTCPPKWVSYDTHISHQPEAPFPDPWHHNILPSGLDTASFQLPLGTCYPSSKNVACSPGAPRESKLWGQPVPEWMWAPSAPDAAAGLDPWSLSFQLCHQSRDLVRVKQDLQAVSQILWLTLAGPKMRRRLLLGQPHWHLGNTVALDPVSQAGVNGSSKAGLFRWKLRCRAVGCPKKKKYPLMTARPQGQTLGSRRAPEGRKTKVHSGGPWLSFISSAQPQSVCFWAPLVLEPTETQPAQNLETS